MSEFKHTPGPWSVQNGTDVFTDLGAFNAEGVSADGNDGWHIADCNLGGSFVNGELVDMNLIERRANARLIAAAPELLDALMELAGWYREHTGLPPTAANAAIAKALGEQP